MEALIILLGELAITCFVIGIVILRMPTITWRTIIYYNSWNIFAYNPYTVSEAMFPDVKSLHKQWITYRKQTCFKMFVKYGSILWTVLNLLFLAGLFYIKFIRS